MALCDEIYMKHHASELIDLDAPTVKLWREGQERWCQRTHGMSVKEYGETFKEQVETPKEYVPYEFDNDGVGGYGSSGRKPLPKEYWDDLYCIVNKVENDGEDDA